MDGACFAYHRNESYSPRWLCTSRWCRNEEQRPETQYFLCASKCLSGFIVRRDSSPSPFGAGTVNPQAQTAVLRLPFFKSSRRRCRMTCHGGTIMLIAVYISRSYPCMRSPQRERAASRPRCPAHACG